MDNQKKLLFITGAGSGLGQLAAQRALKDGWAVAALDINAAGLDILGESPDLLKLVVDITDADAVKQAVTEAENQLGPIYRVTNAAAIMPLGEVLKQPVELIQRIMSINYFGLVNVAEATMPGLLARGRGEFISFASMAGHWPMIYMGAYNASKFAVVAYTEVLHHENRNRGVQVVCVCPPAVATPLLQQAHDTVWPKLFSRFPPLSSEQVLDAVERSVVKGRFWCFPGPITSLMRRLQRCLPGVMWWYVHRVEQR